MGRCADRFGTGDTDYSGASSIRDESVKLALPPVARIFATPADLRSMVKERGHGVPEVQAPKALDEPNVRRFGQHVLAA
ncbi:hypothetical protein [Micromonospora chokoriensis]